MRIELAKPLTSSPWDQRNVRAARCVLELYRKCKDEKSKAQLPSNWRRDAVAYYDGILEHDTLKIPNENNWCHALGRHRPHQLIKAAPIVPHFVPAAVGHILFGSRADELTGPQNALLLSNVVKGWFDRHAIVIVPADSTELTIKRWRIDVVDKSIQNTLISELTHETGGSLDGRELSFRNEKRPAARFMYFHFIIAIMRIRDLKKHRWEEAWARYYTDPPFPTPSPYIREKMLVALAYYYQATDDVAVLAAWMKGNGFPDELHLTPLETAEAARIVFDYTDAQEYGHDLDTADVNDIENDAAESDEDSYR